MSATDVVADPSVDRVYRQHRRRVFAGIFLGYAAYYLVRNNLSLAIPDILEHYPQYSKTRVRHGAHGVIYRLRRVEVPDGLGVGSQQPEVLPAARAAAVVRDHVRLGHGEGDLRLACARDRASDAERMGAGHGLASLRQDHGPLVQHEGAGARRVGLECRPQRRRGPDRLPGGARRDALQRLGREVLLQRRSGGSDGDRRVLPDG